MSRHHCKYLISQNHSVCQQKSTKWKLRLPSEHVQEGTAPKLPAAASLHTPHRRMQKQTKLTNVTRLTLAGGVRATSP